MLLLDLDGVIVDTRANMMQAWSDVCKQFNIAVEFERYFENIGRPFSDIMSTLGLAELAEQIAKVFNSSSSDHMHLVAVYPGMQETLKKLVDRNVKLGIVTSKDTERTKKVIHRLAVDFVTVQTPNGKLRGKPAPDHLLAAISTANHDPAECCYIGDMAVDSEAANRAGICYGHASWGYGDLPEGVDLVLDNCSDLLSLVSPQRQSH